MAYYFWEGASVRLRAAESSDWELFYRWDGDADTMGALDDLQVPRSREAVKEWVDKAATERPKNDEHLFVIETLQEGEVVGAIDSHTTNRRNGTFMYGVLIDPGKRRRGYASDAIIMLLRYFFEELGYQKCNVEVGDFNEESKLLHEKLGFQQEGRLRSMRLYGGKRRDVLVFGMTRDEYDQRHVLE